MPRLQVRRGQKANLPTTGMLPGEPHITTDRGTLHVALDGTTKIAVVPAIEDLTTLATVNGASDLLIIHDADGIGQREKKITVNDFKASLNIPAASSDELVAVVNGGTAGYIWGTDGTDGVLRSNTSISITKHSSNAYVTFGVEVVDGGTF
jgi:hypothetical protein